MRSKPTPSQIRAAKVRAAVEAYIDKKEKPYMGGFSVPSSDEIFKAVSKELGESVHTISICMTYSRYCDHSWAKGACKNCPPADHIPWQ